MLEAKLASSSQAEKSIDGLLDQAVGNLCRLDLLYEEGTIPQKDKSLVRYIRTNLFSTDFNIEPLD